MRTHGTRNEDDEPVRPAPSANLADDLIADRRVEVRAEEQADEAERRSGD